MNGILLVDKPQGWSSNDVVSKLKGVLHERRIGHSGTLDPLATGLLVVFVGRATRAVEFAESADKHYIAGIKFGVTTDTQDITGNVLSESIAIPSYNDIVSATVAFTGSIKQIPPMYSAIKKDGKKLYEYARKGIEIDREARSITIHSIGIAEGSGADYTLDVRCSKGTYIRTLCNDIGNFLGCGACMSSLRRVAAGLYDVSDAYTMDEIIERANDGMAESLLLPVDTMFSQYAALTVNGAQEKKIRVGAEISYACSDGLYRVYSSSHEFLMLGKAENGKLKTVKSFFEV